MTVWTIAAKNAPVVLPLSIATLTTPHHLANIVAVVAGLAFGGMWRAANLRSEGKAWDAVRSDICISIMVGGANAVLALALVEWLEVSRIMAMTIGVLVGATGLRAVPELRDVLVGALRRKLIGDDVVLMTPKDQARINEAMDRLHDAE